MKSLFWLLWAGFIAYAIFLAPTGGAENITLLVNLFTLHLTKINPIILSLFACVGIWLLIYSAVLFFDGRMQAVPFWPFAVACIGTGVIGLLPYLALRQPNQEFSGAKTGWLKLLDSQLTPILLLGAVVGLFSFAIEGGNWGEFVEQFQTLRFVNVMTVALGLFWLVFPTVIGDDLARRGTKRKWLLWGVTVVPLFGALAYLCSRPPLAERS